MNKMSMVRIMVANCTAVLSVKKNISYVVIHDADDSVEEMRQEMLEQEKKFGVYINYFVISDPMPEWMADEVIRSIGAVPVCQVSA